MNTDTVRIVLRVTPQEKHNMTLVAKKEDRTLTAWASRLLRAAVPPAPLGQPTACLVNPIASPVTPKAAVADSMSQFVGLGQPKTKIPSYDANGEEVK